MNRLRTEQSGRHLGDPDRDPQPGDLRESGKRGLGAPRRHMLDRRATAGWRVPTTLIAYAVRLAVVLPLPVAIARACSSAVATTRFSMSANETSASVVIA